MKHCLDVTSAIKSRLWLYDISEVFPHPRTGVNTIHSIQSCCSNFYTFVSFYLVPQLLLYTLYVTKQNVTFPTFIYKILPSQQTCVVSMGRFRQ